MLDHTEYFTSDAKSTQLASLRSRYKILKKNTEKDSSHISFEMEVLKIYMFRETNQTIYLKSILYLIEFTNEESHFIRRMYKTCKHNIFI